MPNKKILVGMSGGVDSSVAAALLKEQGYDVIGVTFRLWDKTPGQLSDDAEDARRVCEQLDIPHHLLDLREQFRRDVVDVFAAEYAAGRTPNPCVLCNRSIKLGAFLDLADELGAHYVATGHYARVEQNPDTCRWELKTGLVPGKDQSYALYALTQEQLSRLVIPLGGYAKAEIRALADSYGLEIAAKPDSQDICFVPDGDHAAFLEGYTGRPLPRGQFVDESGAPLGPHNGIGRYTIGQRKGLGIALGRPMFVSAINPHDSTITLVAEEAKIRRSQVTVTDINWVALPELTAPMAAEVKLRYSQKPAPARLIPGPEVLTIEFTDPQRAPTPGQAAVFYRGDVVLGGGTIV